MGKILMNVGLSILAFIVIMLGLMMSESGHPGGGIVLVICGIGMVVSILLNINEQGVKMVNKWKVTAIIFIIYSVLLTVMIAWGINIVNEEEKAVNECYYNTCEEYYDGYWEAGVCTCYDIDEYGEYEIVRTVYNE